MAGFPGLIEKFGIRVGGLISLGIGLCELAPFIHVSDKLMHGAVLSALGLVVIIFGDKLKKSTDMFVKREAEKAIDSTSLPASSQVPQIQREIDKIQRASGQ